MSKFTLKAARVNVGLTQANAAKELNVSNKTLGRWEKGETLPKPEQIPLICALYNLSYDEIIFFNPQLRFKRNGA